MRARAITQHAATNDPGFQWGPIDWTESQWTGWHANRNGCQAGSISMGMLQAVASWNGVGTVLTPLDTGWEAASGSLHTHVCLDKRNEEHGDFLVRMSYAVRTGQCRIPRMAEPAFGKCVALD